MLSFHSLNQSVHNIALQTVLAALLFTCPASNSYLGNLGLAEFGQVQSAGHLPLLLNVSYELMIESIDLIWKL